MTNTDTLTEFQQELIERAEQWLYMERKYPSEAQEAKAAFKALVMEACSTVDDHGDWCDCGLTGDEHMEAYERWCKRNTVDEH